MNRQPDTSLATDGRMNDESFDSSAETFLTREIDTCCASDVDADNVSCETNVLPCPVCGQQSDSIKCYNIGLVIFLLFAVQVESRPHIACPKCMRREIVWKSLLPNILSANLFFPFVLILVGIQLLFSYVPGHSQRIIDFLSSDHETT